MRRPSRARTDSGAAAVEFGLIAVVLLTLVMAIIQLSIWFWAYQVGAHAAREGARVGAVNPCDPAAIQTRVDDRVGSAADGAATAVTTTPDGSPVKVGDQIKVAVTFNTHEIGGFVSFTPAINKSATSRIENVPSGGC